MRRFVLSVLSLLLALSLVAAKPKPQPPPRLAPDVLPHAFAQILRGMSKDGQRQVTFRAAAVRTHFFFEEKEGVTVYHFDNGQYVKKEFMRGSTLVKALKKYAK